MYNLKYMVDKEGELIGQFKTLAEAQKEAAKIAEDMHPEQAADLVIRKV